MQTSRGEGEGTQGCALNDKPHSSRDFHLAAEERQMATLSALPRARLLFMQTFEDLAMCKSQAGAAQNHICAQGSVKRNKIVQAVGINCQHGNNPQPLAHMLGIFRDGVSEIQRKKLQLPQVPPSLSN